MERKATTNVLSVRRIAVTGVLAAIAILLNVTRLAFIPVPNVSGNATILHVPAIIGGVLEGPVVGLLVGLIFGIYSWLQATIPLFKNPLIAIIPRLFIGVTAYYCYVLLRRKNEYLGLVAAATAGTLTNTILVLGLGVALKLIPGAVVVTIIPQAIAEIVIAVVITVAVVSAWRRTDPKSRGKSSV
jgi:uncharacterized membrane protein